MSTSPVMYNIGLDPIFAKKKKIIDDYDNNFKYLKNADLIIAETEKDYLIDFQIGDLITKPLLAVLKECERGNIIAEIEKGGEMEEVKSEKEREKCVLSQQLQGVRLYVPAAR